MRSSELNSKRQRDQDGLGPAGPVQLPRMVINSWTGPIGPSHLLSNCRDSARNSSKIVPPHDSLHQAPSIDVLHSLEPS